MNQPQDQDPAPFLMKNTGLLCQPLPRYDYRAEWMKRGLVIPLTKPYS